MIVMKKRGFKNDDPFDWVTLAQKKAILIKPKPQKQYLPIFQTFHKPKYHPLDKEGLKEDFSHNFQTVHFFEKKALEKKPRLSKIVSKVLKRSTEEEEDSLAIDHLRMKKKIVLALCPHLE